MHTTVAIALLGGLSPVQFMRRHWQKRPLLVRQAVHGVAPPLTRTELFGLAQNEDVQSRLLVRDGEGWRLRQGPLARRALPSLKKPGWTLLVQGLDLHLQSARSLLDLFRFVPEARLDDLMISYATDGGGVGAHVDSYDVFLLQVHGRRRWRIGRQRDQSLLPGLPLKILSNFKAEQDWVLEPGDMLYLPPLWGHDGVAVGDDCMTCSIGFRAPARNALARSIVQRALDETEAPQRDRLYRDSQQPATEQPARIPPSLIAFATDAVARLCNDAQGLSCALGEVLSEPKPQVWFERAVAAARSGGVRLDRRSRMLYDERRIYLNGESYLAGGLDARAMRQLADQRRLDAAAVARLSTAARDLLSEWSHAGWVHHESRPD